jgi:hypothetical protein
MLILHGSPSELIQQVQPQRRNLCDRRVRYASFLEQTAIGFLALEQREFGAAAEAIAAPERDTEGGRFLE